MESSAKRLGKESSRLRQELAEARAESTGLVELAAALPLDHGEEGEPITEQATRWIHALEAETERLKVKTIALSEMAEKQTAEIRRLKAVVRQQRGETDRLRSRLNTLTMTNASADNIDALRAENRELRERIGELEIDVDCYRCALNLLEDENEECPYPGRQCPAEKPASPAPGEPEGEGIVPPGWTGTGQPAPQPEPCELGRTGSARRVCSCPACMDSPQPAPEEVDRLRRLIGPDYECAHGVAMGEGCEECAECGAPLPMDTECLTDAISLERYCSDTCATKEPDVHTQPQPEECRHDKRTREREERLSGLGFEPTPEQHRAAANMRAMATGEVPRPGETGDALERARAYLGYAKDRDVIEGILAHLESERDRRREIQRRQEGFEARVTAAFDAQCNDIADLERAQLQRRRVGLANMDARIDDLEKRAGHRLRDLDESVEALDARSWETKQDLQMIASLELPPCMVGKTGDCPEGGEG
jgi:hypothetical protein